jgi:Na+/melibiose symporter-like transporter
MVLATLGQVAVNILYVGVLTASNNDDRLGFLFFELTAACLSTVFFYVAVFQMRRTLLRYYNHTQPIGLRLSGAMTFFIQHAHHFSRLAKWQESGYLEPQ